MLHDKNSLSEDWTPSTVLRLRVPVSTCLRSEGSLNVATASGKALAMPEWKARNWDSYVLVGAASLFVLGVAVALPRRVGRSFSGLRSLERLVCSLKTKRSTWPAMSTLEQRSGKCVLILSKYNVVGSIRERNIVLLVPILMLLRHPQYLIEESLRQTLDHFIDPFTP